MDEVTKIDLANGAIIWRLGGRHNQFEIRDDPMHGFSGSTTSRSWTMGIFS
jgi:hypothetical protein